MSCHNCRESEINCPDTTTSSCVSFQGDPVTELDICVGDSLTYVENIVLSKIKDLLKGKGILLPDLTITDCAYISGILGVQEKNLLNILNTYKQAICTVKEDITDLTALIDFTDVAGYTLGCLAPNDTCGEPLVFKTLIQSIINKLCVLNTQYNNIALTILDAIEEGTGNFLVGGAIKSCGGNGIKLAGSGASATVTFESLVPPSCPILYTGSITYFDTHGVGLPNTPYCGWFLCNGNNGTPNSTTLPQNAGNNLTYIVRFN